MKHSYVYILTNKNNSALYTGVTSDIARRMFEHQAREGSKFAGKYNLTKLVYVESFTNISDAIAREKQIKAGSRKRKTDLIDRNNPEWKDLSEDIR